MVEMPATTIERDASVGLVQTVASRLEGLIISGAIESGSKLNELAISQKIDVSRSVLREAVRLLEKAGLVYLEPNRGVFVRKVSLTEALDLFDVRAGLAHTAGRLAVLRATDQQIAALSGIQDKLKIARGREDFGTYHNLNTAFHSAVMAMTGNKQLVALDEMLSTQLQLFRRRNLERAVHLDASQVEHARILEAIRERDGNHASRAFERHIANGRQRMFDTLPSDHVS